MRLSREVKKVLLACAILIAIPGLWVLYAVVVEPPRGPTGERRPPDEDIFSARIIASGITMLNQERDKQPDHIYRRDAHANTHGCALATFSVNKVADRFRRGLFAEPKDYRAWIRFSSGDPKVQSGWVPDARGMAIKVLGVPGDKLLEGEEQDTTQDFLMINNPTFFIANVKEYALLTRFQSLGSQFGYFASDDRGLTWNVSKWRPREFGIALGLLTPAPFNLLATRYYSMTAFRSGKGQYVKYSSRPVACTNSGSVPSKWNVFGRDALRRHLIDDLRREPACFDFLVQPQVPDKNMPVEDPTVEWSESESPFVPLARIRIDVQDIVPQLYNGFCENLSFTPWHSLREHEPVGGLNRVRKAVYQAISRYRRCRNGVALGEPRDDGSMSFAGKPCVATEPVP